ncbi:glycosyltransferase [Phycicoccus endophyticus]|uniref:4,4'-diaponeurosporenoate glycosyltransferase n=1 Tax=Phycicoccus endophyticus TaxID=1690220 RepID=A0A7G9QZY8_9MICO|nr:glycosyltransferase [Phycicoccus endophyticus]NHI20772.1 glycosyltransferase [Phycicoccus endophyticus]QNN48913.1 glycosyltransferase [Phycicoccus endophyticus]GGL43818.1 glycosyl transferase [Phycicoccus endophyticus]
MSRLEHVVVAVPARDEEAVLGDCLDALLRSVTRLRTARPGVGVEVVVALDRCLDASAQVAASRPVTVVRSDAGSVGAARRLAVAAGLAAVRARGGSPRGTWVAGTDADCLVPVHWLTGQLALADAGAELVVGTVEPVGDVEPARLAAWHARHSLRDGHEYVHGANLGIRGDTYLAVGGFADLPVHEDVALVAAVRARARPEVATDQVRVRTSARRLGRVEGGFASYLAGLPVPGGVSGSGTG